MQMAHSTKVETKSNHNENCNNSIKLTDEMFRAICKTGGVAGFNQYDAFVGEQSDLNTVCDHFLHFMELDPDCKHIALGGDLDGCESLSEGFTGVESYPDLADQLLSRGLCEENLYDIYWNNALGVMKRCCI